MHKKIITKLLLLSQCYIVKCKAIANNANSNGFYSNSIENEFSALDAIDWYHYHLQIFMHAKIQSCSAQEDPFFCILNHGGIEFSGDIWYHWNPLETVHLNPFLFFENKIILNT